MLYDLLLLLLSFYSLIFCRVLFKPTGEAYIYDISTGGTYINDEKVYL